VFISTDKAADPKGVMGATKRLMELYLKKIGHSRKCEFITVRFGNVIGSKGSVVPLFIKQINRGGPVTVSDPAATRFFMTVKEASLLVVEASLKGEGGEIYILDMGEALNILEMAKDIIILTGHEPQEEIPVEITGLREGEKLHEILVGRDESLEILPGSGKIMLAGSSADLPDDFESKIEEMVKAAESGDRNRVLVLLSELVPGFSQTGGQES
jgi:FlaA1/EpsC-like NDP-sugar epimerase